MLCGAAEAKPAAWLMQIRSVVIRAVAVMVMGVGDE